MRRCSVLVAFISATLGPIATAGATHIYWSTGFGQTIERANVDGTGREVVLHTTGTLPGELAIDKEHGQVYWTGVQGRGIWRANLDGSGGQKLVAPAGNPYGIALDAIRGQVYWAEGPTANRIMRANLDGSGSESLLTTSAGYPCGLTLDLLNDHMYWLSIQTGTMYRSNLDGSGTVQVLKTGVSPVDLALDVAGGKVYWTENGSDGLLRRANLDGSGIQTLVSNLGNPLGIALDLATQQVYWADHYYNRIQRANTDGSQVETVVSVYGPEFIALHIPEPGSLTLILLGALGLYRFRRRHGDWTSTSAAVACCALLCSGQLSPRFRAALHQLCPSEHVVSECPGLSQPVWLCQNIAGLVCYCRDPIQFPWNTYCPRRQ